MCKATVVVLSAILSCLALSAAHAQVNASIAMAVEFTDHAASAYIAMERKIYKAQGLHVEAYESYATGMALSGALTRGHIDAAYMCLVPAINAYSNGGVPIKVVAGTHLYGYGLVVNPDKVKTVQDLALEGVRIGCMQAGSAVDMLLHKTMENYNLDKKSVLSRIRRMSPEKAILAIRANQLDAAFLPEHWASMAEQYEFGMLLSAKDIWPGMIGSVLVVRVDLIQKEPQTVRKLVRATRIATEWMNDHPEQRAEITARYLSFENNAMVLKDFIENKAIPGANPQMLARSMERLEYTMTLETMAVQEVIDDMARLGYIKASFAADDILDLQFTSE